MPRVVVHLCRRDLLRAQFQMLLRQRLFVLLYFALLAYCAWELFRREAKPEAWVVAAGLVVPPLLVVGASVLLTYFVVAPIMLMRVRKAPGVLGEHTFEITSDGLQENTVAGETRVAWGNARKVLRTRSFQFAMVGARGVFLFPRRAFASASAYDDFWNALQPLARKKNS